jgi:hypothetical protein
MYIEEDRRIFSTRAHDQVILYTTNRFAFAIETRPPQSCSCSAHIRIWSKFRSFQRPELVYGNSFTAKFWAAILFSR